MNWFALAALFVLLLLNGFFVASEFAFTAASRHQLAGRSGRRARAALKVMDELPVTLAGAQLGITTASLMLGAVAEPALAHVIESAVGGVVELSDTALHTISLIVALLIIAFFHMVIGEMGPKNATIADPERAARWLALPYRAYSMVFRPVIWLLNAMAAAGLRLLGIEPPSSKDVHTADDLAMLITAGRREGVVEDFAHRLLTGAIDLSGLRADSVMVPRTAVVAVASTATVSEVEQTVLSSGHSRIPVYEGTIDEMQGFVHAKDLLRLEDDGPDRPIPADLLRPLLVVPESSLVSDLLEQMRRRRSHLAVVVDEHGGTAGIVTMEDIVEEVVGEIRDEHDPQAAGVRRVAPGRYLVDASLRPAEVERACGVVLPEGEYETVGGLVMDRLGRIPGVGDRVVEEDWSLTVVTMDGRRVGGVELATGKAAAGS